MVLAHDDGVHGADACRHALDVIAQRIDIVVERVEFGRGHHVTRLLGDVLGGAFRQVFRGHLRLPQCVAYGVGDLYAENVAEHRGERLLPIRIEAFGQGLQPAGQFRVAGHPDASYRRAVFLAEKRQLREQPTQCAAYRQVGFVDCVRGPDPQPSGFNADLHRQRGRFQRQRDALALQRPQGGLGVGVQQQCAVQRRLQRTAGQRFEGIERRGAHKPRILQGNRRHLGQWRRVRLRCGNVWHLAE